MFPGDRTYSRESFRLSGTKTILQRFKEADRMPVSTFRTRCLFPRGRRVFYA
ncbi:hypothetical protein FHW16_001762 [Phyllobacterium myrsinacearum]|uniref:Uncharacterized protein n=1 Tax=Phyllobacterium myrsinacearum TaxID=28101 RepID=A0A839EN52_9HYPH|nr:hypothetical protein [Phyllobacterium myrsinacearum]